MSLSNHALILTFLAFASTTVDDFGVVTIFFAREYVKARPDSDRNWAFFYVLAGQVIGFTVIVGISLGVGVGLSETVSNSYIDLIGFLPLTLGVYKAYDVLQEDGYIPSIFSCCCASSDKNNVIDTDEEAGTASEKKTTTEKTPLLKKEEGGGVTKNALHHHNGSAESLSSSSINNSGSDRSNGRDSLHGKKLPIGEMDREAAAGNVADIASSSDAAAVLPVAREEDRERGGEEGGEVKNTPNPETNLAVILDEETVEEFNEFSRNSAVLQWFKHLCACWLDSLTIEVSLYALMFGTDNIAVYVALFATVTDNEAYEIVGIFYALLLFYVSLSIAVVFSCPFVARFVGDNFKYVVPLVLIGLGIYVLHGSVIWADSDDI